jgi:hypothetical protein
MQVLEEYKQNWRVPMLLWEDEDDGIERILMREKNAPDEREVHSMENCVFKASIRHSEAFRKDGKTLRRFFITEEDETVLPFTPMGMDKLLEALHRGDIEIREETGGFFGLWTFKNYSGSISTRPLSPSEKLKLNLNHVNL